MGRWKIKKAREARPLSFYRDWAALDPEWVRRQAAAPPDATIGWWLRHDAKTRRKRAELGLPLPPAEEPFLEEQF